MVETKTIDADGNAHAMPTRAGHLLADESERFPVGSLNPWELEVLDREMGRLGAVA